jgi:hypothetical protein
MKLSMSPIWFCMADYSLIDILTEQQWKHALFTTYALSLTFFESYVLRHLHKQGCREIYLITDADGYQMSLSERRSNRVGQEYRLIPVALPKGVFHSKCVYLSSSNCDILAVGSGNMTFGGFGRNLEVFEIFNSQENSQVFLDFAEFLELLEVREDFIIPDKSWIQLFSSRARDSATIGKSSENTYPRLLNCVSEPIIDQLENICSNHSFSKEITIMSPFYDPDGIAVCNLAKRLSANKICIVLPQKQKTTFPFSKTKDWGLHISAVKPVTECGNRSLHAKWIEIELNDDKRLKFTGSVNSTNKSLCSIDNIEIGVLRIDDRDVPWVTWDKSPIPKDMAEPIYKSGGLGQRCLIHASIRNNGVITGNIMAISEIMGEWEGYLENSAADQIPLKIQVNENGEFTQTISTDERILYTTGLQIILNKDEKQARGWVNQEDILRLSREMRSIVRFIIREETIEDEIALLDFLSLSASRHLSAFSRSIIIEKNVNKLNNMNSTVAIHINLADIAPDGELLAIEDDTATQNFPGDRNLDIFTQLRRRLLGHRISDIDKQKTISSAGTDDEDPDIFNEKQLRIRPFLKNLDYFDDCIKDCIDKAPNPASRRAAFVIWFEVKMYMLQHHQEREKGLEFLWEWFRKACSTKLIAEVTGPLEQHLFTAAAILSHQANVFPDKEKKLIEIHESLERFAGGEISLVLADEVLLDHPDVGFSSFLLNNEKVSLRNALHQILGVRTLRRMLSYVLEQYETGNIYDESLPLFAAKTGKNFLAVLKQRPKGQFYKGIADNCVDTCSFCYMTLPIQAQYDLKHYRIARCSSCSKFIVNLKP